MVSMKEIIAERDKNFFLLITSVGFISVLAGVIALIYIPNFTWLYIFVIALMGFVTVVGVIGLCFPRWVIIRELNTIIIHNGFRGFRKKNFDLSDIVQVEVQEFSQQSKFKRNGNIKLTIKSEVSSTKDFVVINIKNVSDVVDKLNSLIHKQN